MNYHHPAMAENDPNIIIIFSYNYYTKYYTLKNKYPIESITRISPERKALSPFRNTSVMSFLLLSSLSMQPWYSRLAFPFCTMPMNIPGSSVRNQQNTIQYSDCNTAFFATNCNLTLTYVVWCSLLYSRQWCDVQLTSSTTDAESISSSYGRSERVHTNHSHRVQAHGQDGGHKANGTHCVVHVD